jgi:hypothetical protein
LLDVKWKPKKIKTKLISSMPIFNCLAYDWTVKDKWKVTWWWHDPKLLSDWSIYLTVFAYHWTIKDKWKVTWWWHDPKLLSDWSIYLTVLNIIGRSKINGRLHDVTSWFMVFNATFNNISAISWRSVLLVEEIGVPRENHRSAASHLQTLSQL